MRRLQRATPSAAVLWASAFVVSALIIIQGGRLPDSPASAETVMSLNDYVLLTSRSGQGPDERPYELLYVIDNYSQVLLVYDMANIQQGIVLRDGGPLDNLFRGARQ